MTDDEVRNREMIEQAGVLMTAAVALRRLIVSTPPPTGKIAWVRKLSKIAEKTDLLVEDLVAMAEVELRREKEVRVKAAAAPASDAPEHVLDTRTYNICRRLGLTTWDEIATLQERDLIYAPGFGAATAGLLRQCLTDRGLEFRKDME